MRTVQREKDSIQLLLTFLFEDESHATRTKLHISVTDIKAICE